MIIRPVKEDIIMIFYFSGTGNSQAVAEIIAAEFNDTAVSIFKRDPAEFDTENEKMIGFVFPCFSYRAPKEMTAFAAGIDPHDAYTFAITTFSNKTGNTLEHLGEAVRLDCGYGLKMPDNMPVFARDVETPETAAVKLRNAKERLYGTIIPGLKAGFRGIDTDKGDGQENNSPMFRDFFPVEKASLDTERYYAEDTCIGCGLCEANCPVDAIELVDGKPVWKEKWCAGCMACINKCPVEAIQYGEYSKPRMRYVFKGFDL